MLIMTGVTLLLLALVFFRLLDEHHLIGGIVFLLSFGFFVVYFIRCARRERYNNDYGDGALKKNIVFIILGIVGVVAGAWLLIESAVSIAVFFGVPEIIIALSMVAVGTSLPELVVSMTAAYKRESDIAVGNIVGSNVFNILLILGIAALVIPLNAYPSLDHILFLLAVTLILFPILYMGHVISRKEGVFLLMLYSFFIWYLFDGGIKLYI
jgi:cation:H+ antiporter